MSTEVSCSSNDLTISWDGAREADHYLVSVTAENGGTNKSCNTTNDACTISNVTCGNTFSVQVTSVKDACLVHSQTHSVLSGLKTSKVKKAIHPRVNSSAQSLIQLSCLLSSSLPASGNQRQPGLCDKFCLDIMGCYSRGGQLHRVSCGRRGP